MSALIIFGASVMAILFFVLQTLFKAFASACSALMNSLGLILTAACAAFAAIMALCIIAILGDSLVGGSFMQLLWLIPLIALAGGLVGAFVAGFGQSVLEILLAAVSFVVGKLLFGLEYVAAACEKGYIKFLTVTIRQVDKC